ncbi:mitochondrial carrier domain-containing protein [Favolaschia claudopus]|uniref:Mitochondrial carrier domain-containing protein n=1 Tax=Favolaschia claudopus TaxID=2862362 RepID=A0AAW0EI19_9AGAR
MAIQKEPGQKGVSWSNIAVGAIMNMVTTLGQPLEVLKTQMAANRSQPMWQATKAVWARGGAAGFFQGLIPWAWIEASTKGAVLIFTASEIETATLGMGINPAAAGLLGGMTGGIAQAYATMGFTTCMKTAEITRQKTAAAGIKPPSTWALFMDIYRKEGLAGVNKGVNAVAVRQCTNWEWVFARLAETGIRRVRGQSDTDVLRPWDKILASSIGGALATWNQPIEVVRIEMQSMVKDAGKNPNRPAKLTVFNTLGFVYKESGIRGLYRGVTPRIGLGIWQTICMVSLTDYVKIWLQLAVHPLRTKAITTATLCFLQEVLTPPFPKYPDAPVLLHLLARSHVDLRALKMAIYGFLVSAPLSHFLVGLLQKAFAGKTGTSAKIGQIVANNLLVAPVQTSAYLASMAIISGAKSVDEVVNTIKAGFFSVIRITWITSPIALTVAQRFIPVELWVPFFNAVQFVLGTYFNARVKQMRLAALAKKAEKEKEEKQD